MPYQLGETFDLGRAYAQATQVQGAQQDQELRGLQMQVARRDLAKPTMSYDDTINHARILNGALSSVAADPSDENVRRQAKVVTDSGVMGPDFSVDSILQKPLDQRAAEAKQGALRTKAFLDNAVDPEKRDLAQLAASDRAAALKEREQFHQDTIQSREDIATQNADLRRDIAASRPPPAEPAPAMTEVVDPKDPKRLLRVDARLYKGGSLGDPGVLGVSGKEPAAAKADETRGTGKDGVTSLTTTLRDYYNQLQEGGGIVDTKDGGISNAITAGQASGVGQFAGRVFGTKNQSIRNQIAQQRPLLLQAIRQATGMSAKAMDSNVELKLYLAAATDPTLDYQANLSALDKIDQLYGTGLGSGAPAAVGSGSQKSFSSEAEVNAAAAAGTLQDGESIVVNGKPAKWHK